MHRGATPPDGKQTLLYPHPAAPPHRGQGDTLRCGSQHPKATKQVESPREQHLRFAG